MFIVIDRTYRTPELACLVLPGLECRFEFVDGVRGSGTRTRAERKLRIGRMAGTILGVCRRAVVTLEEIFDDQLPVCLRWVGNPVGDLRFSETMKREVRFKNCELFIEVRNFVER